jgi:putative membrane protein insertion efficiency factor
MSRIRGIGPVSFAGRIAIGLIRAYRKFISPLLPPSCIYTPTCSTYAETAIGKFGILRGSWLAFRRILRCNPFRRGGEDPVPETWEARKRKSGLDESKSRDPDAK